MDNIILDVQELDISFGGVHAVDHFSFQIKQGELLGLIGPNGSGKSTCVNMITGAYKQDSGKIIFCGEDISNKSMQARSFLGITRTFQSPRPFLTMTVYDSIYTIARLHSKNKAEAVAITEDILELLGFADIADWVCSKLPIEKRKWLDMGRCMVTRPKLMCLDECLAGLTPSEIESSIQMIRRINEERGITILFIEHVMAAVAELCHRVVVLNEGRFLMEGVPSEVMQKEEVIKAYLGEDYVC